MGQHDSSGAITVLQRQIKDLRNNCGQSENHLEYVKRDVQFTRLAELRTENEFCIAEMVRLRQLCDTLVL